MGKTFSFRWILSFLGIAAAGTAVGASAGGDQVFAKQFACEAAQVQRPHMIYDAELQMMVDPVTHKPVYEHAGKLAANHLPTVTSGCSDCPKCDDYCE